MVNVARPKRKIFIGEYGPIPVSMQEQATYGDLIRYIRKRDKVYPDDIAILYGGIIEGNPVTGRHILRMEQTDSFFPKNPNRRWVLAKLLRMPPELMAYLSLEPITSNEQEAPEKPTFALSPKVIDTEEYYNTLQKYWIEGYPKGLAHAIKDVKRRIFLLKDKVLFEFSSEKPLITRLLCGYKVLLADYAIMQQDSTAAQQYLAQAFTLASERRCYDLQAIALKQRMLILRNNEGFDNVLSNFELAQQLKHSIAPQTWGQMVTLTTIAQSHFVQNEKDRLAALKHLDEAEERAQPIATEDFQFFVTFDKERYFLDSAQACMASPTKKMRSPKRAEEYLREATKESNIKGESVNVCRQIDKDLVQALIYYDQEYYPIAATTAEKVLVILKGLQSRDNLNEIATLFVEIKEHYPDGIEVARLELELMKAQQPYLFE